MRATSDVKVEIMKHNSIRKDELENVVKIVKCLEKGQDDLLWYRKIGKICNINHKTVSRLIDKYLGMFVDITEGVEPFQKIKLVRLKPGNDLNKILRYMAIKQKIETIRSTK